MNNIRSIAVMIMLAIFVSGCMYPGTDSTTNGNTTGEYIILVENAVITYKERSGILPIFNSKEDTPVFEKYRIDFQKLIDANVLSQIPPDAFEKGGNYYYMIIDPETEPKIKLLDLRISQAAADVQRLIDDYKLREGKLPFGNEIRPHFYTIDFEKLGMRMEQAKSVYSPNFLVYLMHESGKVAIDYAPEIMKLASQSGVELKADTDLRQLLVEQFQLLPVSSYPYYWENDEPVIAEQ